MKRVAFLLAVIAASLVFFSSCEKETVLSVDQQLLTFTDSGGSQILSLTANKPWTVSSDQSWCKVTPTAGEEADNSRISVNCDTNTTYDTRYCNITFTCAEIVKTVSVAQDESDGMLISPTEFDLSNDAQQVSVEVKANVKFSVAVDDACKSWIRHSATKGLTTSTVILDISKNEDYDGREGRVTISQTDGSLFSTIKIRQSQNNGLFITTPEYELSNESHQLSVEVKSNVSFEVASGASWIKYVETKSLNTSFIVLDIEANQDYDKREGKVIVKQKGGGLEDMITIKQDQNYGLLISKTEYELSNEAQAIDVEVKHNVEFDVIIPADCKGWISKVTTKGLETNTMTFSIAKNDTYDNRQGSITFKQKNGSLSGTVKVVQAQTDGIQVEKEAYSIDSKGGSIEVNVKANVDYETTIDDTAKDWISVVSTKTLNPSKITLSVAVNEDEQSREGKVYVKQSNGSAETSFIVKQVGKNTITAAFHDFAASSVGDSFSVDVESTVEFDVVIPKDATWVTQITTKAPTTKTLSFQVATNKTTKSRVATIQFVNTKEGLSDTIRVEQPQINTPLNNEILYVSTDGSKVTPYQSGAFNTTMVIDTLVDWKGSIRFKDPLETIGDKAFYNRANLQNVILPEGLKRIGESAFDNCIHLEAVSLPSSATEMGHRVFQNCRALKTVKLPQEIKVIYEGLFSGCSSLESMVIPENVSRMHGYVFKDCKALKTVTLPSSLTNGIESYTFYGCTNLTSIQLPNGITYLDQYVFQNCSSLESIEIPEGVESIGWDCFWSCAKLKEVKLPSSLITIGSSVFRECKSLMSVTIPEGVTSIGNSLFKGCTNLSSINLPEGITVLPSSIFSECGKLSSIEIPKGVTSIEEYAFEKCIGLSSLVLPEGVVSLGDYVFSDCTNLENVNLPKGLSRIPTRAFSECTELNKVTIPQGVTSIGICAFVGCNALTSIVVPEGVEIIEDQAFVNCKKLAEIQLPNTLKTIGFNTFGSCGLKSIIIPDSVTSIGGWAFTSCEYLETVKMSDNVSVIKEITFNGCRKLKAINLPKATTEIQYSAFNFCESLDSIEIPEKVSSIGEYAFTGCRGLKQVKVLPTTPPKCDKSGFLDDTNDCPILVPKASLGTYQKAENWKEYASRMKGF